MKAKDMLTLGIKINAIRRITITNPKWDHCKWFWMSKQEKNLVKRQEEAVDWKYIMFSRCLDEQEYGFYSYL